MLTISLSAGVPVTQARALDQFFTCPDVAIKCVSELVKWTDRQSGDWLWVEPSAGGGAFLDAMPYPQIGLDISSARSDVMKVDFLHWCPGKTNRRVAVVGNPPFGKNASLARAFVNHAAGFADVIAFIVPRTFEKDAFINKLDRRLHLVSQHGLDEGSFELDGEPYSVPTVFQIWERRKSLRPLTLQVTRHADFSFVPACDAHFAFQRVGARAGLASIEGLQKSPQSHYFLKARDNHRTLLERLSAIDWTPIKTRTAGNPSIGKGELIAAYSALHG
jgi:hypothetical protein